jgi:hypothetical protein
MLTPLASDETAEVASNAYVYAQRGPRGELATGSSPRQLHDKSSPLLTESRGAQRSLDTSCSESRRVITRRECLMSKLDFVYTNHWDQEWRNKHHLWRGTYQKLLALRYFILGHVTQSLYPNEPPA